VLPYFLVSYLLSVTDSMTLILPSLVRLSHYFLGNFGFLIPNLFYMYLGATAKELFALFTSKTEDSA